MMRTRFPLQVDSRYARYQELKNLRKPISVLHGYSAKPCSILAAEPNNESNHFWSYLSKSNLRAPETRKLQDYIIFLIRDCS